MLVVAAQRRDSGKRGHAYAKDVAEPVEEASSLLADRHGVAVQLRPNGVEVACLLRVEGSNRKRSDELLVGGVVTAGVLASAAPEDVVEQT
jgi:hypothetical protein